MREMTRREWVAGAIAPSLISCGRFTEPILYDPGLAGRLLDQA